MTDSLRDLLRPELAAEFRRKPLGRHSPALQGLLVALRRQASGDYLLVAQRPGGPWLLARRKPGGPMAAPPEILDSPPLPSLEAAEWEVFRRRWRDLTGAEPPEDAPPPAENRA